MVAKKLGLQPWTLAQSGLNVINTDASPSMTHSRRRHGVRNIVEGEGDGFESDQTGSAVVGAPRRVANGSVKKVIDENTDDDKNTCNFQDGVTATGDIVDEIEDVLSDVEQSGRSNKVGLVLSRVLTRDDRVIVPKQLDDDPVPSMSEDSVDEDKLAGNKGRKKHAPAKRSKKSATDRSESDKVKGKSAKRTKKVHQPSNTLYKLWKSSALIDALPVDRSNGSAASGSSSLSSMSPESLCEAATSPAHVPPGLVKLKVPRPFLKEIKLLSPSSSLMKALHERPQYPSSNKKKSRRQEFALMSDNESDIARFVSKRQSTQCDKAASVLDDKSLSPPTPPQSISGEDDDDSGNASTESTAEQGKASDGIMSGSDSNTSALTAREKPKKPIHPFFLKKTLDSPKVLDLSAELSGTDADLSTVVPVATPPQTDGVKQPIHPFFLGSKARATTTNLLNDPLQQSNTSGYDTDALNSSSKEKRIYVASNCGQLTGTSTENQVPSNAIPPEWPSRTNRHVIHRDPTVESLSQSRKSTPQSRLRKLKTAAVHILKSEDVVEKRLSFLKLNDKSAGYDKLLPFPIRHVMKAGDLQILAQQHVDLSRHPYLEYLYRERLPHQCAFDRADFEDQMWSAKYAPQRSIDIAVMDDTALLVRKWLSARMDGAVDRSKVLRIGWMKSMQRRQKQDDLDGFICFDEEDGAKIELDPLSSSEDDYEVSVDLLMQTTNNADRGSSTEDDLDSVEGYKRRKARRSKRHQNSTEQNRVSRLRPKSERPSRHSNVLILSGPASSFKTASVYAAAVELGYFVFEIHAGQKRSGKDILDQVGEMSQSHIVHHKSNVPGNQDIPVFKQKSFLLVEDVDTIYEDDKAFWSSLTKFIETSKRPVILTCTDKSLIPVDLLEANPGSLIEFTPSNLDIETDMLWMISLCEGHLLPKSDLKELLQCVNGDLRAALAQLQFWCQMAVGDERKGLSWVLIRSRNTKQEDMRSTRVISENTFTKALLRHSFDSTSLTAVEDINDDCLAMIDAPIASCITDIKHLETVYDLLSSADLWRSRIHTAFEVPLIPDSDEQFADPWQPRDMTLGCPMVASELQRVVEPYDYELNMSDTAETIAQSFLDSQGLRMRILDYGFVH
ncbi:uncharacterized protein V1513DRAFT_452655 [Lipomyces chichibuensis]|uniref:uncharacterized protein n=1 Tax=Lipomyces chichibuensis TaxID=1546026 RepID=UPI0033439BEB